MASLIYLASAYSHTNPAVREHRYYQARRFTIEALTSGLALFSPIVYGKDMERAIGTLFEPWQTLNDTMIEKCDEVWVLCLEGWMTSRGVRHELELANSLDKPVKFFLEWGKQINVDP